MRSTDSFEKTLMLGKIEGGRRRGQQRMRYLDSITNSIIIGPIAQRVKHLPTMRESQVGKSPGEGNGNPLQYSGLGNPMDRGAWRDTVHGIANNQTHLSDLLLLFSHSVVSDSLQSQGMQPARLLCPQGFSRPEYWSGLPCPPPRDLPNPGIKPRSPILQADYLLSEPPEKPNNTVVGSISLSRGSS